MLSNYPPKNSFDVLKFNLQPNKHIAFFSPKGGIQFSDVNLVNIV